MNDALPLVAQAEEGDTKVLDVRLEGHALRPRVLFFHEAGCVLQGLARRCWDILDKRVSTLESKRHGRMVTWVSPSRRLCFTYYLATSTRERDRETERSQITNNPDSTYVITGGQSEIWPPNLAPGIPEALKGLLRHGLASRGGKNGAGEI